jgi:acyl dehydratase
MPGEDAVALRAGLERFVGRPMSAGESVGPEPVNVAMIHHWVDAFDDRHPAYEEDTAAATRFGSIMAPPAMLQTWTMPRPVIQGLAERGGAPAASTGETALSVLDAHGYTATRAVNSELTFERPLRPGDRLRATNVCESISDEKTTALGRGFFVTWVTTYVDESGSVVGTQLFRVLKFAPTAAAAGSESGAA